LLPRCARHARRARLVPLALLAGIAVGVAAVAVHQLWWGLLLAIAAALLAVVATPAGWATRLPFALGFDTAVALLALPRGEGDYLVSSSVDGYAVVGLALAVLMIAVSTLPRPGRSDRRPTEGKAAPE
jgi:hypothetical protein